MRYTLWMAVFAGGPVTLVGQTILPLDQTRSTSTLVSFAPCAPVTEGETAVGFDPFDSSLFTVQECTIGWSGTSAAQSSAVQDTVVTASGSAFTKTNGGGAGAANIAGDSFFQVLFAVTETVDFQLTGTLSGGAFGDPEEAVVLAGQVQFTALGDPLLFDADLTAPGPFDISGTLAPGEYLLTALAGVAIDVETVPSLVVGDVTYDLTLTLHAVCTDAAACADGDGDGIRDDGCKFADCSVDGCVLSDIAFADMGGSFGACPPDGFANIHDRTHALRCFSATTTCDEINIDAGGAFGSCAPDGFCNVHDANHALAAFAGSSTCMCPGGPLPESPAEVVGNAQLRLQTRALREGVAIDVWISPVNDLRSYQMELAISGGVAGHLVIDSIAAPEYGHVFDGRRDQFDAFNVNAGAMLAGLEADRGVDTSVWTRLATYTVVGTADARGRFVVDLAPGGQTALVASGNREILIEGVEPAVVNIAASRHRRR